ncbi:MAG: MFS transporter [Rhodocyclaceae bacterium]|nr:MFS transporter [Rhodocyclaceae bacterium]
MLSDRSARMILIGKGLRSFADGYVAVLLPAYLLALGFNQFEVGLLGTLTLAGSALATLAVGSVGHRWPHRRLLLAAALVMAATGIAFASLTSFWPLALIAFVGTLNPSSGDVSVFMPLEQARLANAADGESRTVLFSHYTVTGSLCAAVGALASGLPVWFSTAGGVALLDAMRLMFAGYGSIGAMVWLLYRRLPGNGAQVSLPPAPLGPSRRTVFKLAALFSVDAFAGGLVVNSLLALWLFERFGMSLAAAGAFFFWAGLLTTASQWIAPRVAQRIGLLNTMVFTHIPANVCLILAALAPSLEISIALLFARSALSQMDVPTRVAYVMAVVTPPERAAAASFTAVPRSLAAAVSPSVGGALFAAGWLAAPLILCGALKIAYDLALWRAFRHQNKSEP